MLSTLRARLPFANLMAVAVLLATAASAPAQERAVSDPRGDLRARGLTSAERRAMDITRVRAMFDGDGLLVVEVRFAGNLGAHIGRGSLRRAATAVVVRPRGGRATVVVTAGSRRDPRAAQRGPGQVLVVDRRRGLLRVIIDGVRRPRDVLAGATPRPPTAAPRASQAQTLGPLMGFFLDYLLGHPTVEEEDAEAVAQSDRAGRRSYYNRRQPPTPPCRALRAQRAAVQSTLNAVRGERDRESDAGKREQLQQEVDALKAEVDDLTAKIAACENSRTGLPEDFKTSWAHGAGRSRICVYVMGAAGQTGTVRINGTAEPPDKSFTLDSGGRATVTYGISSTGSYTAFVTWRRPEGRSVDQADDFFVPGGPDPNPPPAGFSVCPPP